MINTIVAAALAMSTAVLPQADVPPGVVTIDMATVNGTGCPNGTAAVDVSPDNAKFHVVYSSYIAQVGVGAKPTDFRKNCQLSLRVNVPEGFTYGISEVDYRGFVHLARGASSTLRSTYYFQGSSQTEYKSHNWQGPVSDNWQATDVGWTIVYQPCGENRNLNLNTELRVGVGTSDPKTTTSFMAMDSTDVYIATDYHFAWKRCP
jgi:hypothetical protein